LQGHASTLTIVHACAHRRSRSPHMGAWHGLARKTSVDTRAIMKEMDADCANALQAFQSELELLRHVHGRAHRSHPLLSVPPPLSLSRSPPSLRDPCGLFPRMRSCVQVFCQALALRACVAHVYAHDDIPMSSPRTGR